MDIDLKEEEQAFPWTQQDVLELHKLFDKEFAQTHSHAEGEALFQRFFAPDGLVDKKLREWEGKDVPVNDVMAVAFELFSFKCFVYICFFFNDYPEQIVKEWWQNPGMRSWMNEQAFLEPTVKEIKQAFDKEAISCHSMLDLEGLRGKYLSPVGVLAQEFRKMDSLDHKHQVAMGAELLSLNSYINYALFAIEFTAKAEIWTVPAVRVMQYEFESELKTTRSAEDLKALETRYLGEEGKIAQQLKSIKGKKKSKHAEELAHLNEALQTFFSSHKSEERQP
jgi:hypothetical protein